MAEEQGLEFKKRPAIYFFIFEDRNLIGVLSSNIPRCQGCRVIFYAGFMGMEIVTGSCDA